MSRKKLRKIREVDSLPNVFNAEAAEGIDPMFDYLPQGRPVTLEIGCGRGDYTIGLAQTNPARNFIGVDLKGARLWTGAKWAEREALKNVAFLRAHALALPEIFRPGAVEEIWLPFPDPFSKKRNAKWRVTSPSFLEAYQQILRPGGKIHLKTDDPAFYEYSLETLILLRLPVCRKCEDIYAAGLEGAVTEIQTKYEERHLADGKRIMYICFGFDAGDFTGS